MYLFRWRFAYTQVKEKKQAEYLQCMPAAKPGIDNPKLFIVY